MSAVESLLGLEPAHALGNEGALVNLAPLVALSSIARIHQIAADPATLAHKLGIASTDTVGCTELLRAAQHLGLKAKLTQSTVDRLGLVSLPALTGIHTLPIALQKSAGVSDLQQTSNHWL